MTKIIVLYQCSRDVPLCFLNDIMNYQERKYIRIIGHSFVDSLQNVPWYDDRFSRPLFFSSTFQAIMVSNLNLYFFLVADSFQRCTFRSSTKYYFAPYRLLVTELLTCLPRFKLVSSFQENNNIDNTKEMYRIDSDIWRSCLYYSHK